MSNEITPLITDVLQISVRAKISALETALRKMEQLTIEPSHHFSKDVYAREIIIPEGTLLVGKIHKYQSLNIISKGEASVFSIDGILRVKAPHTFVSSPGAKRVILAHTETVWTTVHGTSETDLEKIEDCFIAKDYSEVDGISDEEIKLIEEALCHG